MRNPERILEVLKAIEVLWRRHPDFRLGQLLTVLAANWGFAPANGDLFYIEDDKWQRIAEMRDLYD